jgi:hypothetical protein
MSNYLDDMDVVGGNIVMCKANLASPHFTMGKSYVVLSEKRLMDDEGNIVHPSGRFNYTDTR